MCKQRHGTIATEHTFDKTAYIFMEKKLKSGIFIKGKVKASQIKAVIWLGGWQLAKFWHIANSCLAVHTWQQVAEVWQQQGMRADWKIWFDWIYNRRMISLHHCHRYYINCYYFPYNGSVCKYEVVIQRSFYAQKWITNI